MSIVSEPQHAEAFMISEARHTRSRDNVVILAGDGADRELTAGMVLGVTSEGTASAVADAGNTGDGAMGAITVSAGAKPGKYRLVVVEPGTDVGTFEVFDPDGVLIGSGVVASAFSLGGLAFTLADGAADFVAGDAFTITVLETARKYLQLDLAQTVGGEHVAAGILRDDVTALDGVDGAGVAIVRDAEVAGAQLVWPDAITAAQIAQATLELARAGIIVR
jgi:Bacteriophage lambda head decoration protein D